MQIMAGGRSTKGKRVVVLYLRSLLRFPGNLNCLLCGIIIKRNANRQAGERIFSNGNYAGLEMVCHEL